jgi:hypothetical protein
MWQNDLSYVLFYSSALADRSDPRSRGGKEPGDLPFFDLTSTLLKFSAVARPRELGRQHLHTD